MNRKRLLLYILLAVLAMSVGYAYWSTPRQERVSADRTTSRLQTAGKADAEDSETADLHRVHFEMLGEEPAPFPGAKRDIFSFRQKPVKTAAPALKPAPRPAAPPPPPPVVSQDLPRVQSKFEFLGFLEKEGKHVVFLSSGDEIYVVREGERFGRNLEFEVADINNNVLSVQRTGQAGSEKFYLIEKDKPDVSVSAPARVKQLPMPEIEEANQTQGAIAPARRNQRTAAPSSPEETQPEMAEPSDSGSFENLMLPMSGNGEKGEVNGTN